jgi:ribosomal protein L11
VNTNTIILLVWAATATIVAVHTSVLGPRGVDLRAVIEMYNENQQLQNLQRHNQNLQRNCPDYT